MIEKVLSFFIKGNLFGIDIRLVKEIIRNAEFTIVPGARKEIVGLLNMRGQAVTIFDFSQLVGARQKHLPRSSCIILKSAKHDPNHVGFLVDRPGDVVDVTPDAFELPPANLTNEEGEYIKHVMKLDENILAIIEPQKLFK